MAKKTLTVEESVKNIKEWRRGGCFVVVRGANCLCRSKDEETVFPSLYGISFSLAHEQLWAVREKLAEKTW